jgi:hypothetical protein
MSEVKNVYLPPETHRREFPSNKILHQYIRLLDEFLYDFQTFWSLEVYGDGSFISVDCKKIGRLWGKVRSCRRCLFR